MSADTPEPPDDTAAFDAYRGDLERVERRIAREIEPGGRGVVVAILVFVLLASFILPHTGDVRGWDLLFGSEDATVADVTLPMRVFGWLALVFGVGFSMLALMTRRWAVAWVALAGSATASVLGLLAVWSRQTAPAGQPGPAVGLLIAWFVLIALTFHWARVVWSRTVVQLAAEQDRRRAVGEQQAKKLLDDTPPPDDPGSPGRPDDPAP
ncbi:hypothetical protein H7J77_14095 [Mycolicibacillus parakoreensis]|uniref:Transmembrane protein n=1 Tax=Mycolicibacillus parakoreensis TaxID=1069221 RepID=A0ABY3TVB3_9MYCO|nr:hypothetical protein [Mycolicibacillus parakoreensis]MCV7316665.1 hypothetical protein [Mycolicibacillus parakoreensis]ULN51593.1 hypothetical protein MIU77_11810 [Mycolicibacillus parakoreensis]HLR99874.1 hypothetical protein [Mycolicibacillus parakoreensis]